MKPDISNLHKPDILTLQRQSFRKAVSGACKADMIAVDGNPLEDITAVRRVVFAMRSGMIYKNTAPERGRQAMLPPAVLQPPLLSSPSATRYSRTTRCYSEEG